MTDISQAGVRPPGARAHAAIWLAAALLCASAQAVGLGELAVHSRLGQPLRASIALIGSDDEDALRSCARARLQTLDGAPLGAPAVSAVREGRAVVLNLSGTQKLYEPVLTLVVELSCEGKSQRDYAILLDPVEWPSTAEKAAAPLPPAVSRPAPPAGAPATRAGAPRMRGAAPAMAANPRTGPGTPAARPPAGPDAPARPAPTGTAVPRAAAAPMRNVLRLAPQEATAPKNGGAPDSGTPSLAETEKKLREVQARLAALDLDGAGRSAPTVVKPAAAGAGASGSFTADLERTEQQVREMRAKILALQIETKNGAAKEPKLIPAVKPTPAPAPVVALATQPAPADSWLVTGLGVLLAACMAIIVALMLRMRQMRKFGRHSSPF